MVSRIGVVLSILAVILTREEVGRVMRNSLPKHAMLSKEAKECMLECCTEFIAFITSEALDKCQIEKRKCISGEDILLSMNSLGFENYAEMLRIYLIKYREFEFQNSEKGVEMVQSPIDEFLEWD